MRKKNSQTKHTTFSCFFFVINFGCCFVLFLCYWQMEIFFKEVCVGGWNQGRVERERKSFNGELMTKVISKCKYPWCRWLRGGGRGGREWKRHQIVLVIKVIYLFARCRFSARLAVPWTSRPGAVVITSRTPAATLTARSSIAGVLVVRLAVRNTWIRVEV